MANYIEFWKQMPANEWISAKELGVAPASMTAMVRRNMVEATNTSPKKYRRIVSPNFVLFLLYEHMPREFVGIQLAGEELDMLCTIKNGKVYDCWGEPYDIATAVRARFGRRYFDLTTGKEIV